MTIRTPHIKKIKVLACIFSLLWMFSCIEEYSINIDHDRDLNLVVDGRITSAPGPYTITLSTTTSVQDPEFNPVKDAIVQIKDDLGNSEMLVEEENGVYKTSNAGIQGIVGRSYKLIIQTSNGKNYETEFEKLLTPIQIESLTYERESHLVQDFESDYEEGIQFYVTTQSTDKASSYFCWELEETFEIHSFWKIKSIYKGDGWTNHDDKLRDPSSPDSLYFCWKTIDNILFTGSTAHYNSPKISNLPLNFVSFHKEMLRYKYSLLLKQYTVSENTHSYYKALLEQDDGMEGFYTTQPYQIQGNVYNIDDPDEVVLGYFLVAGVHTGNRTTVARPFELRSNWRLDCEMGEFTTQKGFPSIDLTYKSLPELWPVYIAEFIGEATDGTPIQYIFVPPPECIDCTSRGGVTKKPDYWDQ